MSDQTMLALIESEEDAFRFLEQALRGDLDGRNIDLSFDNWPVLKVKIEGKGYDSTITAEIAEAIVLLQKAINRSYARLVRNSSSAKNLSDDERKKLAVKAKVEKGSSVVEVNLGEPVKELIAGLVNKMEPVHVVITVVSVAVLWGAVSAYKAYLNAQTEQKTIDAEAKKSIALSAEETNRHQILADALSKNSTVDAIRQDIDDVRREFLRSASDAKSISVQGVTIGSDVAAKLAATVRTESAPAQLNGNYRILKIDWQKADEVKIWLSGADSKREFMATLNAGSLTEDQIETLKTAEWDRLVVGMSINANVLRGEVTAAAIVGVSWPIPSAEPDEH